MIALLASIAVGLGGYWMFTAIADGRRDLRVGPSPASDRKSAGRVDVDTWMTQAGLHGVDTRTFVSVVPVPEAAE